MLWLDCNRDRTLMKLKHAEEIKDIFNDKGYWGPTGPVNNSNIYITIITENIIQ